MIEEAIRSQDKDIKVKQLCSYFCKQSPTHGELLILILQIYFKDFYVYNISKICLLKFLKQLMIHSNIIGFITKI